MHAFAHICPINVRIQSLQQNHQAFQLETCTVIDEPSPLIISSLEKPTKGCFRLSSKNEVAEDIANKVLTFVTEG